jgi:hypothetical protein
LPQSIEEKPFPRRKKKNQKERNGGGLMETAVDMEIQKQDFHIDLKKPAGFFTVSTGPAATEQTYRGGPNQMIKVDQIKWTKPLMT